MKIEQSVAPPNQRENETLLASATDPCSNVELPATNDAPTLHIENIEVGARKFPITGLLGAGLLVVALIIMAASRATGWSHQSMAVADGTVELIGKGQDPPCSDDCTVKKELDLVSECSKPGEDCSKSKCCVWEGMQCYRKHEHWANCRTTCIPGPDLTDLNSHPWSCEKLGNRTPGKIMENTAEVKLAKWVKKKCSKPGQDCSKSKCCAWGGMQCYKKSDHWASCRPSCTPGPDPADMDSKPWNCTTLGPRTPGNFAVDLASMKPAKWVADKCAQDGHNCHQVKCCASKGMQCYEKNEHHASCKVSCAPGPDLTDTDSHPWSCKALGSRTPGIAQKQSSGVKVAEWVESKCAKPGQNCSDMKCCAFEGMQCFMKNDHWASCRYVCNAGPDPTDVNNHPWNCTSLGPRTPGKIVTSATGKVASWVASTCAKPGENCKLKKCCTTSGEQCYMKDTNWATCRPSCIPGPDPRDPNPDPWNCTELGFRTPGPVKKLSMNVKVPKWVSSHCAKDGEDCHTSKCCASYGRQCYEKNKYWAVCLTSCTPGKDDTGKFWNCNKIGSRTPKPWGSPSLYCFSVLRNTGYEPGLMHEQSVRGVGIFSCDGYDLACSEPLTLDGYHAIQFKGAAVGMSKDNTAANTELFMNVWSSIKANGKFLQFDWTIKVDPDAVIVVDRLRTHLKPYTGGKSYIVNCDKPTMIPMMFGSLETFTRHAMEAYFAGEASCKSELPWQQWGEDYFMGMCLDKLGVTKVNDFQIISDGVCKGVNCHDPTAAAFHPFKTTGAWLKCLEDTMR